MAPAVELNSSAFVPSAACTNKPINLLRGWPAPALLPASALQSASQRALSDPAIATSALLYGPDPGYQPLREELATWLDGFYGSFLPIKEKESAGGNGADRITITGGASQSIACILQSFTDPAVTRAVWMVAPCYFLACPIFADAGFEGRLRAVPEDEEGINLGLLEEGLQSFEMAGDDKDEEDARSSGSAMRYKDPAPHRKIYRHVIYCVPSFSNPSGMTMSLRRREALVQLARKYDALIMCDDVYDMLQWPTATTSSDIGSLSKASLPRLADIDIPQGPTQFDPSGKHFGHTVSNGSFSKLLGPGLRTGWTYSTADFALGMSQTGSTRSGGAPSQLTAVIVNQLAVSGELTTHINETLRPTYQRRHRILLDAVQRLLTPLSGQIKMGSFNEDAGVFGGYFLWITFPEGVDTREVAARCREEENLTIGYGALFEVHGDEEAVKFDRDLRLCFSWEAEEDLVEGVERLGRVIARMKDQPRKREAKKGDDKGMDEFK